jgi:hypothetical protein
MMRNIQEATLEENLLVFLAKSRRHCVLLEEQSGIPNPKVPNSVFPTRDFFGYFVQ